MDVDEFSQRARDFQPELLDRKHRLAPDLAWYPYDSLNNFFALDALLTDEHRHLSDYLRLGPIADIGAGDGDMSFLLHSIGYDVDIIDNGSTNCNGLRGARLLAEEVGSGVEVFEMDLDEQFHLPRKYGVAFFLGTLYHLQNPFYALRHLADSTQFAFLSTKIAEVTVDGSVRLSAAPLAYLLAANECNNDPTNYWIFSQPGLRRLLDRTGWEILDFSLVGCNTDSDPSNMDRDQRAFCFLKSRSADILR